MAMEITSIGIIETKGLAALVCATDAMLKAAKVEFKGYKNVGSGYCSAFVAGDVASVKAAVDAGAAAARTAGELISVDVIARPHDEIRSILPK
ncbi:MAG: BMC domain-containing protein [Bryobacteraceae bacterium]